MMQSTARPRILVVDDIPGNIKTVAAVLSPYYEVIFATNGINALKTAASKSVDLILLDIVMPEMDGYEVCRRLKSEEETQNIPVIFLTGESGVMDEAKGFMLGGVDFILKPISPPILKVRVKIQLMVANCKNLEERLNKRILELEEEVRVMKSAMLNT